MGRRVALQNKRWLSYDKAKVVLHMSRKVPTSRKEYEKWWEQNRPIGLPKSPHRVYLNDWVSWNDWLQNDNEFVLHESAEWQAYWPAMRYVHGRKFQTKGEYKEAARLVGWPSDIPKSPYHIYADDWVDWATWLGVTVRSRVINMANVKQCVAFCVMEGMSSNIMKVIVCQNGVDELKTKLESIGKIRVYKMYEWKAETFEQFRGILGVFGSDQGNDDWMFSNPNALFYELDSVMSWWSV